jgi:hypothetical protein
VSALRYHAGRAGDGQMAAQSPNRKQELNFF